MPVGEKMKVQGKRLKIVKDKKGEQMHKNTFKNDDLFVPHAASVYHVQLYIRWVQRRISVDSGPGAVATKE